MRSTLLAIVSFIALSVFTSAKNDPGPGPRWRFIAVKKVNFSVDHDVIQLGNTRDEFRKLQLKISDGSVKMIDMKVYFDNGGVQDVQLRTLIPVNSASRVIELEGGLRHLARIEFWYETAGFEGSKARVSVWGR